jgi:hypothetical protein
MSCDLGVLSFGVTGFETSGLFVPNRANVRISDLMRDIHAGQRVAHGYAGRI